MWTCADVFSDYADMMSAKSTTTRTQCQRSQKLSKHGLGVVNDNADRTRLRGHFLKTVKASHICDRNKQVKKVLGGVYKPNSNNLKN